MESNMQLQVDRKGLHQEGGRGALPQTPGTCPKTVTIREAAGDHKEPCGKDLSPGYYHCVDHITDREFFRRRADAKV